MASIAYEPIPAEDATTTIGQETTRSSHPLLGTEAGEAMAAADVADSSRNNRLAYSLLRDAGELGRNQGPTDGSSKLRAVVIGGGVAGCVAAVGLSEEFEVCVINIAIHLHYDRRNEDWN